MATWKKVIVSGSDISQLNNDAGYVASVGGGIISASAEGSAQGTLALNGVDVDVNGMQTGDKPQFAAVTASLLGNVTGNVTGDVTGDVTGNADTATALASAQNFSITGDGTATAVSFDGTGAVALSLSLAANSVDTAEIANDAVTNAKIASDAVNGDSIADGSISTAMFSGSALVTESEGIASNDVDTAVPTAAAVKDYVDNNVTAQDLDGSTDSGTFTVDLDSETLNIRGKANRGIATSGSGQVVSIEISDAGVTNAMLAGSIANAKLANSSIDIAGTDVSLGGQITGDNIIADVSAGEILLTQLEEDSITIGATSVTLGGTITAFSGSFQGDGSGLTGVSAQVEESLLLGNGLAGGTFDGSAAITASVDLDGATLAVSSAGVKVADGGVDTTQLADDAVTAAKIATGAVTADAIAANSVTLGTDTVGNYVATLGSGTGVTIGSNTGEGSTPTIAVDYGAEANTAVEGNTSLTIQGTTDEISVGDGAVTLGDGGTVTIGLPNNVTISGDLTVLGTASFAEETNLAIADRFILLASGSTTAGDGGIVVQQTTQDVGDVFAYENSVTRWGIGTSFSASLSAYTPDAFMAAAINTAGNDPNGVNDPGARYNKKGNLYVASNSEDIWIYS